MPRKDLTGQRFGRLTVIRATDQRGPDNGTVYECLCDCGNTCFVWNNRLTRKGHSRKRSCGCLHDETHEQHGGTGTILHHKWTGMRDRCNNPNSKQYSYYGGRGIRICDEWQNSFAAFRDWALSAGYKDGLSLDRIDVNGNYCPDNCRWISMAEQQANKRSNVRIEYNGETHTIAEWAEITGIDYKTLHRRISAGWEPEKALTQPVRKLKK